MRIDIVKEQIGLHWAEIQRLLDEQQALMGVPMDWDTDEARDAALSLEDQARDCSAFEFVGETNWQWMMLDEIESMRMCDVCSQNPADASVQETHGHVCLDCARHGRTSL